MTDSRKQKAGAALCFGILFLLTFFMVFVVMGKGDEVLEYSDFATHSSWAVKELADPLYDKFFSYPVWHFMVRGIYLLLPVGRECAAALVTAVCIGGTAGLLFLFLWRQLGKKLSWGRICLLDIGLLVLTALYMPWFNTEVYLGQSSPTIWHNPTNMAVKPIALAVFLWFMKICSREKEGSWTEFIILGAMLLLSCFIKPSFVQGFLPAAGGFLLIIFLKDYRTWFGICWKTAVSFLLPCVYFVIQYFSVFGGNTDRGIGIAPFEVMKMDTAHPLISILQAAAFPLFVFLLTGWKKAFRDHYMLLAGLFYIVSLLEFILLIEVQEAASGNFEWALQLSLFVLFAVTAVRFYQSDAKGLARLAGNALLGYHCLSGIFYYLQIIFWLPGQC